ncbi:MAG: precorrin-6A/cobalt-precorrin-6A reductase [Actinomycetota bacterium]|nr:precorrin-6A/cobalt-precorrin-6A reductase [Actinomycetota bacterium]
MPGMGIGTPPGGDPSPGQRIPYLRSFSVLILGGTGQARRLAEDLAGRPGLRVVTSLAGRLTTGAGPLPPGEVRRGGFGGPEGLAAWLASEGIELVVDATHPFAARISRSAVLATGDSHLLRLRRPGWEAGPGDRWLRVPDLSSAAEVVRGRGRRGRRVFLAVGRQSVAAFAGVEGVAFLLRAIEAPEGPVPPNLQVVLDRGPFTLSGELELMRRHSLDTVVTKDSGGDAARAKLLAARELGLPVVMVDRPPLPGNSPVVSTVAEARDLVLAAGPGSPGNLQTGDVRHRPRWGQP